MTDRELLIKIYGHVYNTHPAVDRRASEVSRWIETHFKDSPTAERMALEERVRNLERIVTNTGYGLSEEIDAA